MPFSLRIAALCALTLFALPAAAQVQGLGTRFSPLAEYVRWSGNAGLANNPLYGGGVGFSFGEYLELTGQYVQGETETDFSTFDGQGANALAAFPARTVGLQRYGGALRLNLGSGSLIPFVTAGTGLVRFNPEDGDPTRTIYLMGGAGVQFSILDRLAFSVAAQNLAYRYNPATTFFTPAELAGAGLDPASVERATVNNLALTAGVSLYLGGRRPGELSDLDRAYLSQVSDGLSGLSLTVEPFYGVFTPDPALGYADQRFVGGEAGINLSPLVGLRGFYGRGVETSDPTSFQPIQMYGGLARFRLSEGMGLVPFLTLGGGLIDVLAGYETLAPEGAQPEDRLFALGGAGLEFALSPSVRLHGEARALVIPTGDVEDVGAPDDITINPLYRAGLSVNLGGGARRPDLVRRSELEDVRRRERADRERLRAELERERTAAERREAELDRQIAQAEARGDAAATRRLRVEREEATRRRVEADGGVREIARIERAGPGGLAGQVRTAQGDRVVTIPLPEQGELYVRYGEPGGVQIETLGDGSGVAPRVSSGLSETEIRAVVREALREAMLEERAAGRTGASEQDVEARVLERLLRSRAAEPAPRTDDRTRDDLRALEERLTRQIEALRLERAQQAAPIIIDPNTGAQVPVQPRALRPLGASRSSFYGIDPIAGFQFGRGPEQVFVGVRGIYGDPFGSVRYMPEVAVGLGSQISVNMNAALGLPGQVSGASPYALVGVGVQRFNETSGTGNSPFPTTGGGETSTSTQFTLNLGAGADFVVGRSTRLFGEFSTGNFGTFNRLTGGYRLRF